MKKTINKIYLTWRKGKGGKRFVIGSLKRNVSEGVSFKYSPKGVKEATLEGFSVYDGFPDVNQLYTTNVLEIFSQRLTRSDRSDSKPLYDFWLISNDMDNFNLIGYSQALLPTDNFELLADFFPVVGLTFVTEIAGLSSTQVSSNILNEGDSLEYRLEEENEHDKYAVALYKDEIKLGYVKKVNSRVFHKSKNPISVSVKSLQKNGIIKRAFIKVEILAK